MVLGNLIETNHLLIEKMAYLDFWDEFPIISALVYMMHTRHDVWWIMAINSHDSPN